jgi:hypothetical protein
MSNSSNLTPKLLKGALVKLGEGFLGPIPNVIVFQYNPEELTKQSLSIMVITVYKFVWKVAITD